MRFSVVVPCYNEGENLRVLARAFQGALDASHERVAYNTEVILVNNGSMDDSAEILHDMIASNQYPFLRTTRVARNQGYGFGILSGLAEARGDYLAWTHADLQTDPLDVLKGFQEILSSSAPTTTLVRGRRIGRPWLDWIFTYAMGLISSVSLRSRLFDINAQPKVFHRDFLEHLANAPWDFSLDLYTLYVADREGYQVVEIPVRFGKRHAGEAKGGGSLRGKWKLCVRTWKYIRMLRKNLRDDSLPADSPLASKIQHDKSKRVA
jgi:glycosyltransferase involved in cell wall biosynthesis